MLAELAGLRRLGLQDMTLPDLEGEMRIRKHQRRQAPQHDEHSPEPSPPTATPQEQDDDRNAGDRHQDISGTAEVNQVRIVILDTNEDQDRRGKPEQGDADAFAQ